MKANRKELRSLNQELPALYAEELEMRLETDPLAVGGLWDEVMPLSCEENSGSCGLNFGDCTENEGGCKMNFGGCGDNESGCKINF